MYFYDNYRSLRDKENFPHRYVQHASRDGMFTLCGLHIYLCKTWTLGSQHPDHQCLRCQRSMEQSNSEDNV